MVTILSSRQQAAFQLRQQGLNITEIADRLHISKRTAEEYLYKGRQKIVAQFFRPNGIDTVGIFAHHYSIPANTLTVALRNNRITTFMFQGIRFTDAETVERYIETYLPPVREKKPPLIATTTYHPPIKETPVEKNDPSSN